LKGGKERLQFHVDRLAALLHEHLDVLKNVEASVAYVKASRGSGSHLLEEQVGSLRSLRESIIRELELAREALEGLEGEEAALDLYSLAGYYLEAGSKEELRVLEEASKIVDVSEDVGMVEEARRRAREIVEALKERAMEGY